MVMKLSCATNNLLISVNVVLHMMVSLVNKFVLLMVIIS